MDVRIRFRHNERNVLFEHFDDEVVAVHLGTGVYHSMPGIAGEVFTLLGESSTACELTEALAKKYDAPPPVIEADLHGFLKQLKEEALVVEEKGLASNGFSRPAIALDFSGVRLPYQAPTLAAHRELEKLFLLDPVHDTGEAGWPEMKTQAEAGDTVRHRFDSKNCVLEKFEEATLALNLTSGAYFSFSGAAEDVLLLLPEAPTALEIARALTQKYRASEAEIMASLGPFLARLSQHRLVQTEPVESGSEPRVLTLKSPLDIASSRLAFTPPDYESFRDAPVTVLGTPGTQDELSIFTGNKRFCLVKEQAIFAFTQDGGVVVHLARGVYFLLNATSAHVFRMLEQKASLPEIVADLRSRYAVKKSEVVAAAIILLRSLTALGLIAPVEDPIPESPHAPPAAAATPAPFEPFSIDIRNELREQICIHPGETKVQPAPAYQGRQMGFALGEYFEKAASRNAVSETNLDLAGRHLRIRCMGDEHSRHLSTAFSHLLREVPTSGSADLTIHVWDGDTAGAPPNGLLAAFLQSLHTNWVENCGSRGELRGFHSPEVPALYTPGPDVVSLLDLEGKNAYFFKRTRSPLPYWEAGSPFRSILHAWLSPQGLQFIHGAGVGENGAGVILAGKGGSGKSTTALLCLNAGMSYAGDDYCAVEPGPRAHLHSLYNTAKLLPPDLERFPHLRSRLWNPKSLDIGSTDKSTFFLSEVCPELLVSGFPVRAILLPRVTSGAATTLSECSPTQALAAIAPSTVAQLPAAGSADMERMASLISQLPCRFLNLGSDLARIPDVVRTVLRA